MSNPTAIKKTDESEGYNYARIDSMIASETLSHTISRTAPKLLH